MSENEMNETVDVKVGDVVKVTKGENKGDNAKVIAVYTNSVAVELNKLQKDGTLARTVLNHKEYELDKSE
ncbi:DUF2187 family protein [Evansella sp. AB-P1]|uniref:DUF2187 family protein n=1 Tax=Evansella sp. AB-P1 TaxID=3037653 RepID=UPI00241E5522|nr:DUF2187 family protein [Evansella sp. AB-P1]MDG5789539.1 DUF2187 family protein [Evansella sp. AB-P1]